MKRQQVRRLILLISLLLFPILMNFLSPYVIIDGAFQGILSGSGVIFIVMFITSLFLGRLFCGWLCPMGGLGDILINVNGKRVTSKVIKGTKFVITTIWVVTIISGFVTAGGLLTVNMLHLTDGGISVNEPIRYIMYYGVILIFFLISVIAGRRASCHMICWMAPIMIVSKTISRFIRLPRLRVKAEKGNCIKCNKCTVACPMSIDVMNETDQIFKKNNNCILCGACVDTCPKKCLSYQFKNN